MKTIFEKGHPSQGLSLLPSCDVPEIHLDHERTTPPRLPHLGENEPGPRRKKATAPATTSNCVTGSTASMTGSIP